MNDLVTYLVYDGKIVRSDKLILPFNNRAFQYGDGIFETMHYHKGKILFIDDHFLRLKQGLEKLHIQMPVNFSATGIQTLVKKIISKNKIPGDARVRLQVFRQTGGYYKPVTNNASFIITAEPITVNGFHLNKKGLTVGLCKSQFIPDLPWNNFKTGNSLPYVMAGIYATENKLDDCLLLSSKGKIADATSSNIFVIKDRTIYTPSLKSGCIDGIMRKKIISLSADLNYQVKEQAMNPEMLFHADEIFLTNVIHGIRWVGKFENHTLNNNVSCELMKVLKKQVSL